VARWVDLLDPDVATLRDALPAPLDEATLARLAAPPSDRVRPSVVDLDVVVAVTLVVPVVVREEDALYLQEVDVVAAPDAVVTIRKTPEARHPFDPAVARDTLGRDPAPLDVVYVVADSVAEGFLAMLDDLDEEIEELEDGIDEWPADRIRLRIAELRRDVLVIRKTLGPTRDAIRKIVDGRVTVAGGTRFHFTDVYDRLLRASEHLEFSRDLIAALRDHQHAKIATEQNEVVKRLTVTASLLLFPTFWVGVYGQNFAHMPELDWKLGYLYSWGVIVVVTVLQLAAFRRLRWI
jgi:magnesium transporter